MGNTRSQCTMIVVILNCLIILLLDYLETGPTGVPADYISLSEARLRGQEPQSRFFGLINQEKLGQHFFLNSFDKGRPTLSFSKDFGGNAGILVHIILFTNGL